MISLTENTIDVTRVLDQVRSPSAGAVLLFLGTTRQFTDGRETASLDYEAYDAMAERKLQELEADARRRWEICEIAIVHRVGHVPIGEESVAIAVSSAHRQHAFEAGQWLIDTLKETVPIWKRENWTDGQSEWVHPREPANTTGEQPQ